MVAAGVQARLLARQEVAWAGAEGGEPVVLGVLAGAMLGARILTRTRSARLRMLFAVVILALGMEMIYNGATGRI